MHPSWTRLNREQANEVLDKLSGHRDAVVFSKDVTEVSWRNVPFYTHYKVFRLVNYATMPTFSMTYLSNGEDYIALDGTANPIYTVNDKNPIQLHQNNVIAYLDFFFANVQGSEGDVFIIKDPSRTPFMRALSPNQQQSVTSGFKPLQVTPDPESNSYKVTGTLYYGGGLIRAVIIVTRDGKLSFQEQHLLLTGLHFPHAPYTQQWLEG